MRISSKSLIEIESKLGKFEIGCGIYQTDRIHPITQLPVNGTYHYLRFGYWDKVDVEVLNSLVHRNITFEEEIIEYDETGTIPLFVYQYRTNF
jgi:hypothetical protein